MCGICVWAAPGGGVDGERLAAAVNELRHRGPDSRNVLLWSEGREVFSPADERAGAAGRGFRLGLGHARLSIIDLSPENDQPFRSDDGRRWLTYNGEIYNYLELRQGLGGPLRTSGDTEVLLRLLEREGPDAVRLLNGMWAFAYFDADRRRLVLSRDRFGKKPLFFRHDESGLKAASEYKALFRLLAEERRVEPDYVYGFLLGKRWPVFGDMTSMYRDVKILPAGHTLVYDLDSNRLEVSANNRIEDFLEPQADPRELARQLEGDLADAVRLRLRSDVPVGVMVSGGVDSTAIAAHAAVSEARENVSFYTIDVNDPDDLVHARKVAERLGVGLVEVRSDLESDELSELLMLMTRQLEVPINVGLVTLPGFLVCRKMARDGVRVALDGTGGDEILGGYPGYYHMALENSMRAGLWREAFRLKRMNDQRPELRRSLLGGWLRFFRRTAFPGRRPPEKMVTDSRAELFARHARKAQGERLRAIVGECFGRDRLTDVAGMQLFDLTRGQMPYYLYINDQVSMANSVESRSPFLDYRLAKYLRLPFEHKFHNGYNKHLLRSILPGAVGDDVRWRRSKAGFQFTPKGISVGDAVMEEAVLGSQVLGALFDVPALMDDWRGLRGKSHFHELLAHLYSVALLESAVPMRV